MRFTVFGEILWDIFGEEKNIGGAPFNLAAHAAKLGADVDLISAVGSDENGGAALRECAGLGISCENIAVTDKPTGYCMVTLKDAVPEYDLVQGTAYDFIPMPEKIKETDVFCFGTLAQRNAASRETLRKLLEIHKDSEIFLDVNIRQHYYTEEILDESLKAATILKVSREEAGVFGDNASLEDRCLTLMEKYPRIRMILVTLDSDGAFVCRRDAGFVYSSKPSCMVVSTVGAGDSFSAGFLVSMLQGDSTEESIEKAVALSGFVCGHTGAVPEYSQGVLGLFRS